LPPECFLVYKYTKNAFTSGAVPGPLCGNLQLGFGDGRWGKEGKKQHANGRKGDGETRKRRRRKDEKEKKEREGEETRGPQPLNPGDATVWPRGLGLGLGLETSALGLGLELVGDRCESVIVY